jgi:acetate---CoA ligase (ADP-forming)
MGCDEPKWRDLTRLMEPKTVAVVGASQRAARGNGVINNLINLHFPGKIFPINPKYNEILGLPCYPDLAAPPEPIDCVVVAIPALQIPDLLSSAVDIGIRATVILSSGFGEAGPEGKARQARLEGFSNDHGLLICGPNCWGIYNLYHKSPVFSAPLPSTFLPGEVALVSQSGSLSIWIARPLAETHGVGLSYIVSCGNQAGVTIEEYINYFLEDDRTQVIGAFVEGFRQPQKFMMVAQKALAKKKPIIILKAGKSNVARQTTLAHSGSLAGDAEVVEALFRQNGVIQVHSLNEMVETIALFSSPAIKKRFSGGRRIGMLSGAGGECSLAADAADEVGLEFHDLAEGTKTRLQKIVPGFASVRNPMDGTGAMYEDPKLFSPMVQSLAEDPNLDLVLVNITANDLKRGSVVNSRRFASETAHVAASTNKPIIAFGSIASGPLDQEVVVTLREEGVPYLEGTEFTMMACRHLARYNEFCRGAGQEDVAPSPKSISSIFPELPDGVLATQTAFRLVEAFGIPVVQTALVHTADEAVTAATQIGFPVVLKVESSSVQHKSDVGGVILDVNTAAGVRESFDRIHQEVACRAPHAQIAGVLVQRMAAPGVEVILGIKRDPMFGPVVVCGLGGIFVEILRDVAVGIPPLSRKQAHHLLSQLRGAAILAGARGRPPADVDALTEAVVNLSHLAVALKDSIVALDINPFIVYPEGRGVLAVDTLVQLQKGGE